MFTSAFAYSPFYGLECSVKIDHKTSLLVEVDIVVNLLCKRCPVADMKVVTW